jgi:Rieske Fe-S protein
MACAALALALVPLPATAAEAAAPADPRQVTQETRAGLVPGTVRDYRKQGGFYLVADPAGIYAITAICTHKGCKVLLEEGKSFGCPCHDSEFDLQGAVLQGPAKLPLVHFQVTEASPGGPLVVNLDRMVDAHVRL